MPTITTSKSMYSSTACPLSLILDKGLMLVLKKAVKIESTRLSSEGRMKKMRLNIILFIAIINLIQFAAFDSVAAKKTQSKVEVLKLKFDKNPLDLDLKFKLSHAYFEEKHWSDVIKLIEPEAKKLSFGQLEILVDSYIAMGSYDAADSLIKFYQNSKAESPYPDYLKAKILISRYENESVDRETKLLNSSLDNLKKAVSKDPEFVIGYETWLNILDKHLKHSSQEAITVLEKLIEIVKKSKDDSSSVQEARYNTELCKWYLVGGFIQKAVETCEVAAKSDKKNPSLMLDLAKAHLMNGDPTKYASISQKAAGRFPQSIDVQRHLSHVYKSEGNTEKALETALKAYEVDKKDPATLLLLGELAFSLKNYDLALKAYTRNCNATKVLPDEFRLASGVLRDQPDWQSLFRANMLTCVQKVYGDL